MRHKKTSATPIEIAERLQREERVLVVTHEAPDGDALGSVSAFVLMCASLGVPCAAYLPGVAELPAQYALLSGLDAVVRGAPPKVEEGTTVYFLDCASLLRGGSDGFAAGRLRVNIDHHQDNPAFGEVNLVDSHASSTTAILYKVFAEGGFPMDAAIATSLYVGLVTDTGRFQYSNTDPDAHRIAAELQELGCDVNEVSRVLYESVPLPKMLLLGRVLSRLKMRLQGVLVTSWLNSQDFTEAGADEEQTEGLIDTLRCVAGVKVAALARERLRDGALETKVSLRSTDGAVDVAELAHERGGGGHVRAAGFTTEGSSQAALDWLEGRIASRL